MSSKPSQARVPQNQVVESDASSRLDRLPWSRWHTRIILALGTSWLLDGLEVTLVGSLSGILESKSGLSLTDPQITSAASTYLAGAVIGAILFGYLTDRLGRKKLFLVTLGTYSLATLASAFSWNLLSFSIFRFCTGLGIGGEYSAINSAVDELIPGRIRGTVDLVVNGTYWAGACIGSLAATYLLHTHHIATALGWRLAFGIGGSLGLAVLVLRLFVPESPRWLMLRGYEEQSNQVVQDIENKVAKGHPENLAKPEGEKLRIVVRDHTPIKEIFQNMLGANRERSFLALVLMASQAFFFNAVFFTYGLVVKKFFHVGNDDLPMYLLPFAAGSFFGPILLGRLFDHFGRKPMITITYGVAGLLLLGTTYPFVHGMLGARGLGICFTIIFFVASSAASAAYLTVSEIFPLEIRAFAIAIFYSLGTLAGGVAAPLFFGFLIASGSRTHIGFGWLLGGLLMLAGSVCEYFIGIEAAGKSLESVSSPLQSAK